jgi:hypothetical protein
MTVGTNNNRNRIDGENTIGNKESTSSQIKQINPRREKVKVKGERRERRKI